MKRILAVIALIIIFTLNVQATELTDMSDVDLGLHQNFCIIRVLISIILKVLQTYLLRVYLNISLLRSKTAC